MSAQPSREFWGQFGKKPAKRDRRNFKFGTLLVAKPKLPKAYDFDVKYLAVPTPMFGNDVHGDCVIAGRAHQTLRFEYLEQHKVLQISDTAVLREWHKENGNTEQGLVVLDSLDLWRKKGWKVERRTYRIQAYAEVDRTVHDEVRRAIVMQVGIGLGLTLPYNAVELVQAGRPWDVTPGPKGRKDPRGGHYVYCPGYTEIGPVCVTWGRKQQMTWKFFDRFSDEAYATIDARDPRFKKVTRVGGTLDYDRLDALLAKVTPVSTRGVVTA
jgi:hypothetical protein